MRCKKCEQKAVINMRQHKLGLCKDHFLDWIPQQTQRIIDKYNMFSKDQKILVAVSGGKDSLALWDILSFLGYDTEGLYISLGINGGTKYSDRSHKYAETYADEHNLKLHVIDIQEDYDSTILDMAKITHRGKGRPCSVCGLVKRHIMNQFAREGGYDVLATGHNLDDEAAALFGNTLNWSGSFLRRQGPVLEASEGFVRKVKPLCRLYEREMAAYTILRNIDYMYDECPYVTGSKTIYYKDILNQIEADRPGTKLSFYLSFLKAKDEGLFSLDTETHTAMLTACVSCHQLTTANGLCSFCRLIDKVRTTKGKVASSPLA
jgi:uncharacterized protein (TIGR00269 family)